MSGSLGKDSSMDLIAPLTCGRSSVDSALILVLILWWLCTGLFFRGVVDIHTRAVALRIRKLNKGWSKRRQDTILHGASNSYPPSGCVGIFLLFLRVTLLGATELVGDGERLVTVLFEQLASTYVPARCHQPASFSSSDQPRRQSRRHQPCWALPRGLLLLVSSSALSLCNVCLAMPMMSNKVPLKTSAVGMHVVSIIFMFALPIVYLIGGCACKGKPTSQPAVHHSNRHAGLSSTLASFVGNDAAAAQQTSENTDQVISPRVQNAIDKIKAQQLGIAAEYDHVKQHATISAEALKVLERETKDALGVIRCEIDSATNARDTKKVAMQKQGMGAKSFLWSALTDAIKSLHKQLGNVLELLTAWDLRSTCPQYSTRELKALPLASTQPGTTPTDLTIQRVIGELAVAEAQGKDVAAQMKMALEVYNEGRNSAAVAITNAIIDDDQQYTNCMRPHWISPSEVAALKDLATMPASRRKQTVGNGIPFKEWGEGGELDADALTFDPAAPDATTPARAIYNRHVAASGSIALYEMLCKISSTLSCKVEVIPGGVKALARMVFKSVLNYNGDFSKCRDAIRATMEVNSIQDVVVVVNALLASQDIVILRIKDRFQQSYDSRPIGGYRDFQALCVFKHNGGWVYGEVQINLTELVMIKGREGGGHEVFKHARAIAAYTESTYTWKGAASVEMCERIENGMLVNIDLRNDESMGSDAELFERFLKALQSTHCRVASVSFYESKLGEKGGVVLAEALKTFTSLTELSLVRNNLGEKGGVALAEALKTNTSLSNLSLIGNNLGEKGGVAMAEALKINTSLTELDLRGNKLGENGGVAMAKALTINTSLADLTMNFNNLGEKFGVAMAEALKINTSLTKLTACMSRLGENGGVAMAEALKINTSLTNLILTNNKLGEKSGVAMAEALTINTSLTKLDVSNNNFGEKGGVALAEALKINTSLTYLSLGGNHMDYYTTQASIRKVWGNRSGKIRIY